MMQRTEIKNIDFKKLLKGVEPSSADLILTDPPYAISKKTYFTHLGKKSVKRLAVNMDFGRWDKTEINLDIFAELSYNALRKGGTIICFYDLWKISCIRQSFLKAGFRMFRLIIWEKSNPVPLNSKSIYLSNSREMAVLAVKGGRPTFNSEYDTGIYHFPIHREQRIHPTQKPLCLLRELIKKHSNEGDFVIDPFAGSGSTAIASYELKRHFLGGDKDRNYTLKARKRLENAKTKNKKRAVSGVSTAGRNRSIQTSTCKPICWKISRASLSKRVPMG